MTITDPVALLFLRLSRLILLVILLLFAVIAKIARAETAELWWTLQCTADVKYSQKSFGSPQAVVDQCFPGSYLGPRDPERGYHQVFSEHHQAHASVWPVRHTCDAKELTHNGTSGGVDGTPPNLHWMLAPEGVDAKDWYSDKFTTCENNCVVKNTRRLLSNAAEQGLAGVSADGRSVTESSGKSRSLFYKRQTGEVCVVEKKKPDDPPKPPAPDNGDGSDGSSGSDTGNANSQNNGQGGSNQGDSSNQSGSNSSNNQGSGNSDGGGSSSGGSGGGSGGGNGGSLQIGPSGGGTSGGTDGGNESEGSEGEAGGESDGSGEESGGSGESGGQGGADSGGQGNVNGSQNQNQGQGQSGQNGQTGGDGDSGEAGGHYFPCPSGKGSYKKGTEPSAECLGEGNGDGEGSIGGGSCEADTPPDCKGDPIQCYIAREQWRTACAASGKSNKIEGQGNCERLIPPECKGDETQCYIAKQQFMAGCEAQAQRDTRSGLKDYADGKSDIIRQVESADNKAVDEALKDNASKIDLTTFINKSGYGWSRSCPASATIDAGVFGTFEIDNSMLCTMAQVLGKIFAALCMLFAVRYIFA